MKKDSKKCIDRLHAGSVSGTEYIIASDVEEV